MRRLIPILLAAAFVAGCHSSCQPLAQDRPVVLEWSKFDARGERLWYRDVVRRFGRNVVIVFCHGDADSRPWMLDPDYPRRQVVTRTAAQTLRNEYPGRILVLICCNPQHECIDVPGVVYADDLVWQCPGADDRGDDSCVGHLDEFRFNPPGPSVVGPDSIQPQ